MQDFLLVVAVLLASTIVGYPACLLLPAATFKARFFAAPTIGFAILSAGIIGFYRFGVPPNVSLYAMCTVGLLTTIAHMLRNRRWRDPALSQTLIEIGGATAAIVVLCLLPAWIGGAQFTVFQGNVFDQFNVYLPGSVVFHQYDYATVTAVPRPDNPVIDGARFALNRPISLVHSAFVGTHATATASAYAFTLALQINMFFSALFLAVHIFAAKHRTAILAASALTIGFFQQYVLDINAWAHLSAQPIYLLVVAIVILAFDPFRFGANTLEAIARLSLFFALLMIAATVLYLDSSSVYGVAAGGAAFVGLVAKAPRTAKAIAVTGLGLATTTALSLSYWFGSLPFFITKGVMDQAVRQVNWWRYFQAYLFGRMENHVDILSSGPPWPTLLKSLLVLPVESVVAGIGLYWFLPGSTLPEILAVAWRGILYVFIFILFATAARTAIATWRETPESNAARLYAACVIGCVIPIIFLLSSLYWTAGKSLAIAAPLLFFLIVAPFLSGTPIRPLARAAAMAFLAGHLITGAALRPGMAADPTGKALAGLPKSAALVERDKAGMDWRMDRLAVELRGCNGVILNVKHRFMNLITQYVATDLGMSWASLHPVDLVYAVKPPYKPAGWERADCIASDDLSELHAGRRVIWLVSDTRTFEFLDARSGALEIGVSGHPGVAIDGAYAIEASPRGRLRWTSGDARFRVPNSPDAPAANLALSFWPMPLAPAAQLQLVINGWVAFNGPVPSEPLTIPLDRFAREKWLTFQLKTTPTTRSPPNPRDLGLALRQMQIEKSP